MYVCVYIYIYSCKNKYTRMCIYVYIYICCKRFILIYYRNDRYTYELVDFPIYIYIYTHIIIYTYIYTHTYISIYISQALVSLSFSRSCNSHCISFADWQQELQVWSFKLWFTSQILGPSFQYQFENAKPMQLESPNAMWMVASFMHTGSAFSTKKIPLHLKLKLFLQTWK